MSLINKMLQDLEQRGDSAQTSVNPPISGEIRAVTAPAPAVSNKWFGLLAIGGLCLVAVWFMLRPKSTEPTETLAKVSQPIPAQLQVQTKMPEAPTVPSASVSAVPQAPVKAAAVETPVATAKAKTPVVDVQTQSAKTQQAVVVKPAKVAVAEAPRPAEATPPAAAKPAKATVAAAETSKAAVQAKPAVVLPEPPAKPVAAAEPAPAPLLHVKVTNPQQRSDNLYREAVGLAQQARNAEANRSLRLALAENPANHAARQLLANLMINAGRQPEATALLQEGLALTPGHAEFSLTLARLQVAINRPDDAMDTLQKGMASAGGDADYHAFYAALLQGQNRHAEAVPHFITALRSDPSRPNWLIGVGVSLQAIGKYTDAAEAFQRAKDGGMLSPQLTEFVEQRLTQLK